jgi:DNA replication and repair protein RecF
MQPAVAIENKPDFITAITLKNFRCYGELSLKIDSNIVVLSGPNGAGKTNILEAISLFAPGRGLRSARIQDLVNKHQPIIPWSARIELGESSLSTGLEPEEYRRGIEKRVVRANGHTAIRQTALGEYGSVLWLTPFMDGLFMESGSARRRFLDRLVYHGDQQHATRLNRYEHAMRERNRLLKEGVQDTRWLDQVENTMVTEGVATAYSRLETLRSLQQALSHQSEAFPFAKIHMVGDIDQWIEESHSALEVEEKFRQALANMRGRDTAAGRALVGPQRSDFATFFQGDQSRPAEHCSTGEQKALLLSVILAAARRATTFESGRVILLLDEVVAHLDINRRQSLYEELARLPVQSWLTGTDASTFAPIPAATHFPVENASILSKNVV